MTRYPTVAETVAVHARLIARFGGSDGIRDHGALESALARPRSGHYSDLIQEAAALRESLSQNHPFADGNKRVAVTARDGRGASERMELAPQGTRRNGTANGEN